MITETMITILLVAVMVACWSAFILLLLYKWGIVEWMQVHGSIIISKMAHCEFCLSWWLCLILTLIILSITGDVTLVTVPFIATPLARRIL